MIDEHDHFYDDFTSEYEEMKDDHFTRNKPQQGISVFQRKDFYEVIDHNEATAKRVSDINCLMREYDLCESSALRALRLCNWNYERAINRLRTDDKFFGLIESTMAEETPVPSNSEIVCQSCYGSFSTSMEGYSLPCQHFLCSDCYAEYVNYQFDSKAKGAIDSNCPMAPCNQLLLESCFRKFLPAGNYTKLKHFILRDYVDNAFNLQWCPSPDCSSIIRYKSISDPRPPINISCQCGIVFCASCASEGHQPLNCELAAQWRDLIYGKYKDISEKWIQLNTKRCPSTRCGVPILKNDGCMHMVCESCKFEFCWLCLEEWSKHNSSTGGFYKCNIYVPKDDPDKTKIEVDLQKYNFYSERFFEHLKSVQKAINKKKIATEQFNKLCTVHNISESGEFLQVALDGVIDTRRLLLYTFPLAYFADFSSPLINKEIFAFQQGELEVHLERLERLTDYLLIRDTPKLATPSDVRFFVREVTDMCKTLGQYFSTMIEYFAKALTVVEEQPMMEMQTAPAPSSMEQLPEPTSKDGELVVESQVWTCPKCTFHNPMVSDSCEMCSYRRESLTQHN